MTLTLKCLDVPLPVDPKKVQATLKKKRLPKPKNLRLLRITFKNMGRGVSVKSFTVARGFALSWG